MPDSTGGRPAQPRGVPVPLSRTITVQGVPYHFTAEQVHRLFWKKIRSTSQGCWTWVGSALPNGYGKLRLAGRSWYTHRVSYELHYGPIPQGLHLDHLCRNRVCCNPAHLEAVSCKQNVLRSPVALAAINARKTHCARGHALTGDNLVARSEGKRQCRTCARWRARVLAAKASGRTPEAEPMADPNSSEATP